MTDRVRELFRIIKEAEDELELIRSRCPHVTTENCIWQYENSNFCRADICTDCNDFVRETGPFVLPMQ